MKQQLNHNLLENIKLASKELLAGNIVAFPTETVYGLGAIANNEAAIAKIFTLKQRPTNHPLIVHLANASQMQEWASYIPECAKILAKHFWPGPLSLILPKQQHVSKLITGGQDTVALRVPRHPIALELLRQTQIPLVAPSANKYCKLSPTCAAHVKQQFDSELNLILDGGQSEVGIESTIILALDEKPVILRQGILTAAQISSVLGTKVEIKKNSKINAPGNKKQHYCPNTPLWLLETKDINSLIPKIKAKHKIGLIHFSNNLDKYDIIKQQLNFEPKSYAHNLYASLHQLDNQNLDFIILEKPKEDPAWSAILDRLQRSSKGILTKESTLS